MSQQPEIAAIILAAGQSTRLGRPKQLLPVDGQPLLTRTLQMVRQTQLQPIVLVLGAHQNEIVEQVDTDGVKVVINDDFASGQASSLLKGVNALPPEAEGCVIFLGDQPMVSNALIEEMVSTFDPMRHVAVQPEYSDGRGNPVLLSRTLFPKIQQLTGDIGARNILRKYEDEISVVNARYRMTPVDVDTEGDYQTFMENWSALGGPEIPEFCQRCGSQIGFSPVHDRLRPVCPNCNFTYFFDPKLAVAVLIDINGKLVMQQRAIDPGRGLWTFPSGFVDRGEVVSEAAMREVNEETGLVIKQPRLLDVYSDHDQTVVLAVFMANADGQQPRIGEESTDVRLFDPRQLPELAFPRDAQIVADWLKIRD